MNKSSLIKLVTSLVLLGASSVLLFKCFSRDKAQTGSVYFYDLQEQKLFTAPQGSIPPIAGIKGAPMASVRAIVISASGDPSDKKHFQIAYLEKYTPEIKALFEEVHQARKEGRSEEGLINRKEVVSNTLVRRPQDTEWQPLNSPQGKQIAEEWNMPDADGRLPVVCSP